ncbi:DUF1178 family protein [Sphingomonas canadensis]|uniref:DUF1178 family protein n=1 Tax=Sphingomonas canadensis TaxID=1219257 RepID=A0ABW3H359_9SPHN|nr:DUF1178 family protein [Sphingomonas canadensis]MCW3835675.1 DUF1178 family protein [Sphingomonas canadensis]
MIVFDLKCPGTHVFEAWFKSSAAYEEQRAAGMIACPVCGDTQVSKAVMAPNVAPKGNQARPAAGAQLPAPAPGGGAGAEPPPEVLKQAIAVVAEMQAKLLEGSQWVGMSFADRARAMHSGEEDAAPIHGQATLEQARELVEDGVEVALLPLPVVPPQARN